MIRLFGMKRPSLVWLIPVVALAVGGFLAATTLSQRGPEVTVTFDTASGLSVGTKVLHKAVELGSVTSVALSPDLGHVDAVLRMTRDAKPYLTDSARFWVVRPQISGGSISGLATLLSGSYIEVDPGTKAGSSQTRFKGLESPPGIRSDEPGTTFALHAPTVASLSSGTPVFYRDVRVGEVLGNQLSEGTGVITAEVFVRAPYDKRVRTGSVWWQDSGVATSWEANGLRLEVPSAEAALSGGVAFNEPPGAPDYPVAPSGTAFPLFSDEASAQRASDRDRIVYVVYLQTQTDGLGAGSPVQLFGRQVGDVRDVQLQAEGPSSPARVRATIDVLPSSLTVTGGPVDDMDALGRSLVAGGMRAAVVTTSYVTGAKAISLDFLPQRARIQPTAENGLTILPMVDDGAGGSMMASASGFLARLRALPFQSLGNGINGSLGAVAAILGTLDPGKQATALTATLRNARVTIAQLDANITPTLQSLPGYADALQQQLSRANQAILSADQSFGSGSGLEDSVAKKIEGYYDTVRYVRLLADYLTRHPEAIARGQTAEGSER